MVKVKTVTHFKTSEIKKEITKEGIRNTYLKIFIIGYVTDGNTVPFEADEVYYGLSVATSDQSFDLEVMDTTSLAKAKQRQEQLCNSLHGYRGNDTLIIEYSENKPLFPDY